MRDLHLLADMGGTRTRLGLADARGLIDGTARGPYADIAAAIPVTLIADDTAALRGCARYLAQQADGPGAGGLAAT